MIMTTHITLTAVDPTTPTTLSYPVTTVLLRNRLGFTGVIVTYDLYMEALRDHYTFEQEVVQSVLAGNDLISSVLQRAVASGKISKQRIDESVRRILLLKLRYGILKPHSAG
jgi:beta-N-acetylhexosaminidase